MRVDDMREPEAGKLRILERTVLRSAEAHYLSVDIPRVISRRLRKERGVVFAFWSTARKWALG